jgi:hypothetical protein
MTRNKREVVLEAHVEFDYNARKSGDTITQNSHVGDHPVSELVDDIKRLVEDDLRNDMASVFGLHIETRVIATRYGSVSIFFGVVLSGFVLISRYKNFYDSIQLIRQHSERLLRALLTQKYGRHLEATVSVAHPRLDDPRESRFPRALQKHFPPDIAEEFLFEMGEFYSPRRSSRDAFFWFLLVFCILLLAILGWLVRAAVIKTYFP